MSFFIFALLAHLCTAYLLNGNVEAAGLGALFPESPVTSPSPNGLGNPINNVGQDGKSSGASERTPEQGNSSSLLMPSTTPEPPLYRRGRAGLLARIAAIQTREQPTGSVNGKSAAKKTQQKRTGNGQPTKMQPSVSKRKGGVRTKSNFTALNRIIGGNTALPNEFPYHVALAQDDKTGCGGSILSPLYILTAAHCTAGYEAQYLKVTAGDHILSKEDGHEQKRNVAGVIDHEEYNPDTMHHDISIVRLEKPLELNKWVTTVELADPSYVAKGTVIITGWGKTDTENSIGTDRLQKIDLPIANHKTCTDNYHEVNPNKPITDRQICAGYFDRDGKDACQGDSGGPAVVRDGKKFIQVGVTSYGIGCALSGFPGIYTSVSKYRDWIDKIVKGNQLNVDLRTYKRGRENKFD